MPIFRDGINSVCLPYENFMQALKLASPAAAIKNDLATKCPQGDEQNSPTLAGTYLCHDLCQALAPNSHYSLILRHYSAIFKFCKRYLKNLDDAQEACQEVMVNALSHVTQFESRASVKTWLLKIAFNVCTNYYRKQQLNLSRSVTFDETLIANEDTYAMRLMLNDATNIDNQNEHDYIQKKLTTACDQLSQVQRDILYYRFVDDASLHDISCVLGIKLSNVKMNYYRALEKLNKVYCH